MQIANGISRIVKPPSDLRLLISGMCALLFALGSFADAQQPTKLPKIGFLGVRPDAANYSAKYILIELQKLGYVEGKNFTFEYRSAENKIDRLPGLVDQLLRLKIDVLVTAATRELQAVQEATKELPVVSLNLGEPAGSGLIQSLAHPGGNITGFTPISTRADRKAARAAQRGLPEDLAGCGACASTNRESGNLARGMERIPTHRSGLRCGDPIGRDQRGKRIGAANSKR